MLLHMYTIHMTFKSFVCNFTKKRDFQILIDLTNLPDEVRLLLKVGLKQVCAYFITYYDYFAG